MTFPRAPAAATRLLAAIAALATASLPAQAQPTIVFRGQLVRHGDGPSVSQVVVRVKQFGQAVTNDNGYFEIALPAATTHIELLEVALSDRQWTVLYPTGAIRVPRERDVVTSIILGLSFEALVARAYGNESARIRASLTANGATQEEILRVLEAMRGEFASRAHIEAESLRVVELRRHERAQHYPAIAEALTDYVNEAKDLRNAFKLITEFAFSSRTAFSDLRTAIEQYDPAFQRLNNGARGFENAVKTYWGNEQLVAELRGVLEYALGEVHRVQVLPLNATLMDINRLLQRHVTGREAERLRADVVAKVAAAVAALEPRLEELERRKERLLSDLASD